MSHNIESLGRERTKALHELERTIERSLRTFYRLGEALADIRDQGLYRDSYPNFDTYCKTRWDLSRSRAYQLIDAAAVAKALSTTVDSGRVNLPKTEAHCRALVPLKDQPEQMAEVLETLEAEHGDHLTADTVNRAVQARVQHQPAKKRKRRAPPHPADDSLGGWHIEQRELGPWDGKPLDAIITEPRHGPEAMQEWSELAQLATGGLKPGGDLLVLTWQHDLPDLLRALCRHDLVYRWTLCCEDGPRQHQARLVESRWRPVLWLTKGHRTGGHWVEDYLDYFDDAVDLFTSRGDTIFDPFCSAADLGEAAVEIGRHFIGWTRDAGVLASVSDQLGAI